MRTKRNFLFARKWFKHFNNHMCHWLIVTISKPRCKRKQR